MIKIRPTRLKALENLTQICAWLQSETETFLNYLSNSEVEDDNPYEILSLSEDYYYDVQKRHKLLFMYFDWKEEVEEFIWKLDKILKQNFHIADAIPLGDYTMKNQILEDGVLEYFDAFLRKKELQLTSISSDGDDYLFVVHSVGNFQKVKELVAGIGWDVSEI